jgi:hypothetical protein
MKTTIYIKKTPFGWSWNETTAQGYSWRNAPDNVKTHSDLLDFFKSGGHRGITGGRLDAPALILVDANNNAMKHYQVKLNNAAGLHSASINFDNTKQKSFYTSDLWPEAEQMQFLKTAAVHLPDEFDNVRDAVKYLEANEPLTFVEYNEALTAKIKDGITEQCKQHAAGTPAVIEFTD